MSESRKSDKPGETKSAKELAAAVDVKFDAVEYKREVRKRRYAHTVRVQSKLP